MKKVTFSILLSIFFCGLIGGIIYIATAGLGKPHTITFMVNEVEFETVETAGKEEITMPGDPMKKDFAFEGWFFDNGTWKQQLTSSYYKKRALTEDVKVYAKFSQTKGIISFNLNNSVYSTVNTFTMPEFFMPDAPQLGGYDFKGWFFDNGIWEQPATLETIKEKALSENVEIYARMELRIFHQQIKFFIDETFYTSVATVNNAKITMPTNPTKEYFDFEGWFFDNETFLQPATPSTISSKNDEIVNVYAKFKSSYCSNLIYELSTDETYYIVTGLGQCSCENIFIPNEHENKPVKEIGRSAFSKNNTIVNMLIGKNVEIIREWSFNDLENLLSIDFIEDSKLHTIESFAFNYSRKLESVFIPKGITTINRQVFTSTDSLKSIDFEKPENITRIEGNGFSHAGVVTLPMFTSLEFIGENAFTYCGELTNFYLPKTLKTITKGAFNDTRKMKYVELEDIDSWCEVEVQDYWAVPWVHAHRFLKNNEVVKTVNISEGVKRIRERVFQNARVIEYITIPESCEYIGTGAFCDVLWAKELNINAKNLQAVSTPESGSFAYYFENLGKYTLSGQAPGWSPPAGYKDITVNFGPNVKSIPDKLFYSVHYPPWIGRINFATSTPPTFGSNWINTTSVLKAFNIPAGSLSDYSTAIGTTLSSYLVEV